VRDNSTADGAVVHLWTCQAGLASQRWTYTSGRDLVNANSGKCLDITENNLADGAKLQQWACAGGANQKWSVPA
jgi:glucosylceramidase